MGCARETGKERGRAPFGPRRRVTNARLGELVAELADLMALDRADARRVAHYRRAAMVIRRFHHSLAEMIEAGTDLASVPGVGKGLAGYMGELVHSGGSPRLQKYRGKIPRGLREVMRLDGVGATRARTLGDAGIDSVAELEAALARREVPGLNGFGPAVVARLQRGLAARAEMAGKSLLSEADRVAERVTASLARAGIEGLDVAVEVNGSPGRMDLGHRGLWLCRELGVRVVVSSDAHSATRLGSVEYGVDQARRGWLRRSRIVNTGTLAEVLAWLGRRRG